MTTVSLFRSQLSGRNVADLPHHRFGLESIGSPSSPYYRWGVYRGSNPEPIVYGQVDFFSLVNLLVDQQKLIRQHREHLAAVSLDATAQKLLGVLDQETSIRWEDLPDKVEGDWPESCRAAALLAAANLCEAGPTRLRLNEYGDKLLAELSADDQTHAEVAG